MYTVMKTGYSNAYQSAADSAKKNEKKNNPSSISGRPKEDYSSLQSRDEETKESVSWEKKREQDEADAIKEFLARMREAAASNTNACEDTGSKTLYDATMDLTLIANAENEPALKAIHSRLLFKARRVRASGGSSDEVQIALRKINKVIGKVKTKIKKLKKEAMLEKRRKKAEAAKQRKMEEELRKELERKKKIRKNKERQDVEESKMGLGANYGGEPSPKIGVQAAGSGAGVITGGSADIISQVEGIDTAPISPCSADSGGIGCGAGAVGATVDVSL